MLFGSHWQPQSAWQDKDQQELLAHSGARAFKQLCSTLKNDELSSTLVFVLCSLILKHLHHHVQSVSFLIFSLCFLHDIYFFFLVFPTNYIFFIPSIYVYFYWFNQVVLLEMFVEGIVSSVMHWLEIRKSNLVCWGVECFGFGRKFAVLCLCDCYKQNLNQTVTIDSRIIRVNIRP